MARWPALKCSARSLQNLTAKILNKVARRTTWVIVLTRDVSGGSTDVTLAKWMAALSLVPKLPVLGARSLSAWNPKIRPTLLLS